MVCELNCRYWFLIFAYCNKLLAIVNTIANNYTINKEYFYQHKQLTQNPLELYTARQFNMHLEVDMLNLQEHGYHHEIIHGVLTNTVANF